MKIKHLDRYKKSSIRSYDKWGNYDQCFFFKIFKTEKWIKAIRSEIDKMEEAIILDVGCGTGRILEPLTAFHPKKLCGMDISEGILKIASKKPKIKDFDLELKRGDAETKIPWEDSYFNYVLIPGVFHHFFRPFDALREVQRVLKDNGKMIIVDYYVFTFGDGGFEGNGLVILDGFVPAPPPPASWEQSLARGLFQGTGAFEGQTLNVGHPFWSMPGPPTWIGYWLKR